MWRDALGVMAILGIVACTPASQSTVPAAPEGSPPQGSGGTERTLIVAIRVEPQSIAAKPTRAVFTRVATAQRFFNAGLDLVDDQGLARPYLAESLPRLNTESWRVFADGRMETTYRLKPNLTWHDGTPLSADDFAFAWRVLSTPELGVSSTPPIGLMDEVSASDERTFTIHWPRPNPRAGLMQDGGDVSQFPPLPRHILAGPFQEGQWDAFANHPYWTRDFIGLGPYALERWEPGAFIEGVSFAGHVLGRPHIERIRVLFIGDSNAVVANLLSGAIHVAADISIGFQQAVTVKREWAASGQNAGTVLMATDLWRAIYFQLRPELASPRAILDVRVRRALAHALDKSALNGALYEGEGMMAEMIIPSGTPHYEEIEASLVRYPYDARRSEQLLNEAGFRKGTDGFFTHPADGRLDLELKVNASAQYEAERSIVADLLRQTGVAIQEATLPAAQAQDGQVRASFPALYPFSTGASETSLRNFGSAAIPTRDNRWTGSNRGGWSSAEYDGLLEAFNVTLDPSERVRQIARLARLISEDLPAISLYYDLNPTVYTNVLRGPRQFLPDTTGNVAWNVYEWELRGEK